MMIEKLKDIFLTCEFEGREVSLSTSDICVIIHQLEQADRMREAFEWLKENPRHQLSYEVFEDDEWQVHRVDGPRSDREWTLVGTGNTPIGAIRAALNQAKGDV